VRPLDALALIDKQLLLVRLCLDIVTPATVVTGVDDGRAVRVRCGEYVGVVGKEIEDFFSVKFPTYLVTEVGHEGGGA